MSLATRITSLLTSLTPGQIGAMAPADRQLPTDQASASCSSPTPRTPPRQPRSKASSPTFATEEAAMNNSRDDAVDAHLHLGGPPANDNEPHVSMNGKPCRCTPERRAWCTRGCADTCPYSGLPQAKCAKVGPCLWDCRLTNAHETIAPATASTCTADTGCRPADYPARLARRAQPTTNKMNAKTTASITFTINHHLLRRLSRRGLPHQDHLHRRAATETNLLLLWPRTRVQMRVQSGKT
jgi:hypothetical protein